MSSTVKTFTIGLDLDYGPEAARVKRSAESDTLAGALAKIAPTLPAAFTDPARGLRFISFHLYNGRTREYAAITGQGYDVMSAWKDAEKLTREVFHNKMDGKWRPAAGLTVRYPADKSVDPEATYRTVSRSIEDFQGDETHAEQLARQAGGAATSISQPKAA